MGEHVARRVGDLRERQAVTVDELLEVAVVAAPRDAEERRLTGEVPGGRFDRGGFRVADRSSRRPEPEHDRRAGRAGGIERAAPDQ